MFWKLLLNKEKVIVLIRLLSELIKLLKKDKLDSRLMASLSGNINTAVTTTDIQINSIEQKIEILKTELNIKI